MTGESGIAIGRHPVERVEVAMIVIDGVGAAVPRADINLRQPLINQLILSYTCVFVPYESGFDPYFRNSLFG